MSKERRRRKRANKGKSPDHFPKKKVHLSTIGIISEGGLSLISLVIGSYFSYDFIVRLSNSEKVFCRRFDPPCIGEEFIYGVCFVVLGILGLCHTAYMIKLNKNA